jgi:hypothetical protein
MFTWANANILLPHPVSNVMATMMTLNKYTTVYKTSFFQVGLLRQCHSAIQLQAQDGIKQVTE